MKNVEKNVELVVASKITDLAIKEIGFKCMFKEQPIKMQFMESLFSIYAVKTFRMPEIL